MTISVIIPGYNNSEFWWRRCVESVIATGVDEIVCVDDCSRARPAFLEKFPVKVIYRETNGGLAVARNTALAVATGDYVTFVDSDDEVEPGTFRACRQALEETKCDIAIYGVRAVWPEDGLQKTDAFDCQESLGVLTPEKVLDLHKRCLLNYSCNKVYRRAFLQEHGLTFNPKGMPCEDIVFNLNCILAGATFCTVPYAGYVYYRTRGTLLSKYKVTSFEGTRIASETWRTYKARTPGAREILGDLGEVTSHQELNAEWRNIWMPSTPFSILDRWRWLKSHSEIGGVKAFCKMAAFVFFRRHFYFRPVRRWNTRQNYPQATEWRPQVKGNA